nr:GNAT family N-acetyltransferase [Pseudomonas sp. BIGb0427]
MDPGAGAPKPAPGPAELGGAPGRKRYYLFLASGELIGCLGVRPDAQGKVGLGYRIAEAHARQGLMTEALETLLPLLEGSLLWLTTSPANVACQRLVEGLGFKRVASASGANARLRYELRR